MANNKVEAFGQTLIDLTEDSVTPDTLVKGVTAHNAAGDKITGTMESQTIDILSTKEELEANTEAGKVVDALVVKGMYNSLGGLNFGKDGDGNYGYYGADGSLIPFKGNPRFTACAFSTQINSSDGEYGCVIFNNIRNIVSRSTYKVTGGKFTITISSKKITFTATADGIFDIFWMRTTSEGLFEIKLYEHLAKNTTFNVTPGGTGVANRAFLIVNQY